MVTCNLSRRSGARKRDDTPSSWPRAGARQERFLELRRRTSCSARAVCCCRQTSRAEAGWPSFASLFADLLERSGTKGTQEINGLGGTQVFESVTLPEFTLTIGSKTVALRPASVTLQRNTLIGGTCCLANVGRDVLTQAQMFRSTSQR